MGGGGMGGNSGSSNTRIKKRARVLAVPDPRTSSLVVSAAKDLMDQIEGVVAELDSNPAKKKMVRVIKIDNADSQQLMQVLQDTFQTSSQTSQRGGNQNSALQQRSTTQNSQNSSTTRSTMGGSSSGRGGGSSMGF